MIESLNVVDVQYDSKIKAYSVMTTISIKDYLMITKNSEFNLDIQRKVISTRVSKIYDRLIEDLKTGCIMPPIVLVIRDASDDFKELLTSGKVDLNFDLNKINEHMSKIKDSNIAILDGLQRTNCIRKAEEGLEDAKQKDLFYKRKIRVEFWVDIMFDSILYRMITLNAGQTPMSMKHQLEILNINLIDSIKKSKPDIEIYKEKDNYRRTGPEQYQYAELIEGYTAYLNKSPFINAKNEVIEELNRISFLNEYDNSKPTIEIDNFINTVVDFDDLICKKYKSIPEATDDSPIKKGYQFFCKKSYFVGFCAALGRAYSNLNKDVYENRRNMLFDLLKENNEKDPLQLSLFNEIISGIPSKAKIGDIQSEVTMLGFENFFMNGYKFSDAWQYAGERVPKR